MAEDRPPSDDASHAAPKAAMPRRALLAGGLAGGLAMLAGCGEPIPPVPPAADGPPRRIVSLNPCLDVILVEVVEHERITALSHYSREAESSTIAEVARELPFTWGTAEEVAALSPDLVLNGQFVSQPLRRALERLDIPQAVFPVPETVADSLSQVREVARRVGRPERGEALVARIEAAMAAAEPPAGSPRPSALIFMPGGFASGPGTLMDEMMRRAGFDNAAVRYGLTRSMSVPLEQIVADPPDVLLSGVTRPGAPSRAESLLRHQALAHLADRMRRETFPQKLLFCGGPVLIQTAQALAQARRAALEAVA